MAKWKHTMHLFGGESVVVYGESKRIATKDYGGEMFFTGSDGEVALTVAVTAVEYIETEMIE